MSSTPNTVHLLPVAHYVQIPVAAQLTGYTEKAIRRKIDDGKWLEGREYIKAPDGHILISMKGYAQWAERGPDLKSANDLSGSASPSKVSRSAAL
jgi:hypothetical protein